MREGGPGGIPSLWPLSLLWDKDGRQDPWWEGSLGTEVTSTKGPAQGTPLAPSTGECHKTRFVPNLSEPTAPALVPVTWHPWPA